MLEHQEGHMIRRYWHSVHKAMNIFQLHLKENIFLLIRDILIEKDIFLRIGKLDIISINGEEEHL